MEFQTHADQPRYFGGLFRPSRVFRNTVRCMQPAGLDTIDRHNDDFHFASNNEDEAMRLRAFIWTEGERPYVIVLSNALIRQGHRACWNSGPNVPSMQPRS